jgi:heme exporter protein D
MDLGPHAVFIVAAYAVTAVIVGALILGAVLDRRAQRRALADLEARGVGWRLDVPDSPVPAGGQRGEAEATRTGPARAQT